MDTESIKETVDALGISVIEAGKVLLAEGLCSSKKSLEIQHYLNLEKTTLEIADILNTTEKVVQQYLPYTRDLYSLDNPSISSINCSSYRERIKIAQKRHLEIIMI